MRTTNELETPGKVIAHPRMSHPAHGPRESQRWVRAEDVVVGDQLLGNRGGVYIVLGIARTANHHLALTVLAPSGNARTWIREPRFQMERP